MRVNPEIFIFEGADSFAQTGRQYQSHICLVRKGLPGAMAHIECPGRTTEQERPINNRVWSTRVPVNKGEPEFSDANGLWESDSLIVVLNTMKEA